MDKHIEELINEFVELVATYAKSRPVRKFTAAVPFLIMAMANLPNAAVRKHRKRQLAFNGVSGIEYRARYRHPIHGVEIFNTETNKTVMEIRNLQEAMAAYHGDLFRHLYGLEP
jgi:hypothetical protein